MNRNKLLFEYRSFGQDLNEIEKKLISKGENEISSESFDYYILSEAVANFNILIRDRSLVIKELIKTENKLEKWNVNYKQAFPLSSDFIQNVFFPSIGIEAPAFEQGEYSIIDFIKKIINTDPDLKLVEVYKKKKEYIYKNCFLEVAENLINSAFIKTINVESENAEDVLKLLEEFGIALKHENTSYPNIIKRITGLTPLTAYKV